MKTKSLMLAAALAMFATSAHALTVSTLSVGNSYEIVGPIPPNGAPTTFAISSGPSLFLTGDLSQGFLYGVVFHVSISGPITLSHQLTSGYLNFPTDLNSSFRPTASGFILGDGPLSLSAIIDYAFCQSRTPGGSCSLQVNSGSISVTATLPDGISIVPAPIPAALPLFAAGLGIVVWFGSRRRKGRVAQGVPQ